MNRIARFPIPIEWLIVLVGFALLSVTWHEPLWTAQAAAQYVCLDGHPGWLDICIPAH